MWRIEKQQVHDGGFVDSNCVRSGGECVSGGGGGKCMGIIRDYTCISDLIGDVCARLSFSSKAFFSW